MPSPLPHLIHGDCLDKLKAMPEGSVDAIVTDPPYGLSFMGKKWDYDVPSEEVWAECLRVLKPGGHLLAFAGTRTQHRMAVRIEDAGFEIRDMIAWVYGSGFPKSLDVSKAIDRAAGAEREVVGVSSNDRPKSQVKGGKAFDRAMDEGQEHATLHITAPATPEAQQWAGWGTALKPALEPITVARKPLGGTVAANVLRWGTGGLNVDGCRVGTGGGTAKGSKPQGDGRGIYGAGLHGACEITQLNAGRWPANLIHDGSDEVVGLFPESNSARANGNPNNPKRGANHAPTSYGQGNDQETHDYRDTGSAARFFYCAKTSKRERGEGNNHPTVKPLALMRYLCRLVTPLGGIILDPFMGSGTTGIAAIEEGFDFIGIEKEQAYYEISQRRIATMTNDGG